jgi:hypothetical protein
LILARSDDGGVTWHTHPIVHTSDPLLLASIGANRRGRLGLVYDEIDTAGVNCTGSPVVPTRTLVSTSRDGGHDWSAPATVGPSWFNQYDALVSPQYFLGDYQNIVGSPGGFTTVTVQGRALPGGRQGPGVTGKTGVIVANETAR